jgi:hypothetical protein
MDFSNYELDIISMDLFNFDIIFMQLFNENIMIGKMIKYIFFKILNFNEKLSQYAI